MRNSQKLLVTSALWLALAGSTLLQGCADSPGDDGVEPAIKSVVAPDKALSPEQVVSDRPSGTLVPTTRVKVGQVPEWVELPQLRRLTDEQLEFSKNGMAYLSLEDRVNLTPSGYEYFGRLAYEVTERKGLEQAGQISRTFDPSLETMTFNFVRVTRDGKTSDRLPNLDIQELRREDSLSDGLVDGDITALINVEDVRVGDIIDFGYSGTVETPLWPGHFFNTISISVRRHIKWHRFRPRLRETLLTSLVDIKRRLCGIASVDVGWFVS